MFESEMHLGDRAQLDFARQDSLARIPNATLESSLAARLEDGGFKKRPLERLKLERFWLERLSFESRWP